MDCHEPSVLAMTKGANSSEFFSFLFFCGGFVVYELLRFACNDEGWQVVVCGLLRHFTPRNDSPHIVIAIMEIVIARVAFATRGNPLKYTRNFISKKSNPPA